MSFAIPDAKAGFLATLAGRPTLAAVVFERGVKKPPKTGEHFYILGTDEADRAQKIDQPGGPVAESFDLRWFFDLQNFASQEAVEMRMWAVLNDIDEAIRDDPTLSGAVRSALFVLRTEDSAEIGKRWVATAEGAIPCTAFR